jgi:uncharacterized protein (DUF924 family)
MTPLNIAKSISADVLAYWFGSVDDSTTLTMEHEAFRRWNAKSPAVDNHIRTTYLPLYHDVAGEVARGWLPASVEQYLGAVLVLDQFPRHIYREQAAMYATDDQAVRLTLAALASVEHSKLPLAHRMFLYMPLMHSEKIDEQRRMLELFDQLQQDAKIRSPQNVPFFEMSYNYAKRHLEIVERFGRFPHRNTILGRQSTEAEVAFLKEPNSSF